MTRYVGDLRWRFKGDAQLAQTFIPRARVVAGLLDDVMPNLATARVKREIAEGVIVEAKRWGSQLVVTIDVRKLESKTFQSSERYNPWLPEGFVFYPASDASPNGWGLPIQKINVPGVSEDEQPFAPENLAPGLDVSRWTPGGSLGEVLVTRKPDAGYPPLTTDVQESIVSPPLYHPEYGPHPEKKNPTTLGPWQAYRLEFTDFEANAEGLDQETRNERKEWKRELFRLFNEHRAGAGRDPLNPPIRGDYDSAQATCEWALSTKWWGHSCEGYPITWRDARDRGMKNGTQASHYSPVNDETMLVTYDGVSGSPVTEIIAWTGVAATVQYQDEGGYDVIVVDAYTPHTPTEALAFWLASPPHKAGIEQANYDTQPLWGSWVQIGCAFGSSTAHFTLRMQWIQCGNVYWHSAHAEVPTLSWFGFTSKNLYDDTWPVSFALESDGSGNLRTVISGYDAVLGTPDAAGTASARWYQRLHMPADGTMGALNQGVLGPYIFARGRCIAIVPDSGYVLAAAFIKHGGYDLQYRLVAICLHKSDDPGDVWQGFTPKVRIWWVDLPPHVLETFNGVPTNWIAGNPHTVIRTKYGAEDTQWPWIEANSPYSWRGGNAVDVSSSNLGRPAGDLLSYASMWEFNGEGTKAVCLRYSYDKDLFDWHSTTYPPGGSGFIPASWANTTLMPAGDLTIENVSDIGHSRALGQMVDDFQYVCGTPVFCELGFTAFPGSTTIELRTWTHNPAGGFVVLPTPSTATRQSLKETHWYISEGYAQYHHRFGLIHIEFDPLTYWEYRARVTPLCAFYSSTGEVRAVYDVETNMSRLFQEHWEYPTGGETYVAGNISQTRRLSNTHPGVFYRGLAEGPSVVGDSQCKMLVASATHYSSEIGAKGVNTIADYPIVLHASEQHLVFAALGVDAPTLVASATPDNFPFNLQPSPVLGGFAVYGIDVEANPLWVPGDVVETNRKVVQMDVYMDGARIHSSRHPNPNKFHLHRAWCNPWILTDRRSFFIGGATLKHSYAPRWNTAWGLIGGFVVDRAGNWAVCATYGVQRGASFFRMTDAFIHTDPFGTQYSFVYPVGATTYDTSGPYNLGGFMAASFATQEELAEMMKIPGDNPRAHYVRIV